jgi:hypothetical protein
VVIAPWGLTLSALLDAVTVKLTAPVAWLTVMGPAVKVPELTDVVTPEVGDVWRRVVDGGPPPPPPVAFVVHWA